MLKGIIQIGQKIKGECLACGAEEIWEVERIGKEKYQDGKFRTYHIKSLQHCIGEVRTTIKDCPEGWQGYELNP